MEDLTESELERELIHLQNQKHPHSTMEHIYNLIDQHSIMLVLTQRRQDRIELDYRVTSQYLMAKLQMLTSAQAGGSQEESGKGGSQSSQQMAVAPEPEKPFQMPTQAQTCNSIQGIRNKAHPGQLPTFQPPSSGLGPQQRR